MKIRTLVVSVVSILGVSCGSLQTLTIDQLYPAEVTFPEQAMNVSLVNNALNSRKFGQHVLTPGFVEGNSKQLTEEIAANLAENNYFDQVLICDSALRRRKDKLFDRVIPKDELSLLFKDLATEVIVSVDRFNLNIKHDKFFYPGLIDPFHLIRVDTYTKLRVYVESRPTPMVSLTLSDSLFWDINSGVSDAVVAKEAVKVVAASVVSRLAPQWKTIDRVYFDGSCAAMRDGAVLLRENNFEEARNSWMILYDKYKKGKIKARSAYNVALVYELEGDVPNALEWLKKAELFAKDGSDEKFLIFTYRDVLNKRLSDIPKLNLQMERFE